MRRLTRQKFQLKTQQLCTLLSSDYRIEDGDAHNISSNNSVTDEQDNTKDTDSNHKSHDKKLTVSMVMKINMTMVIKMKATTAAMMMAMRM